MTINSINGNTALESGSFPPARVASTGSSLTPTTGGLIVVDGVQLVAGDRVLCKDETSAVNNGIYAANTGPWVRATDASTNQQFFSGMAVTVGLGAVNAGLTYLCTCTDDPVVVGTSLITFAAQATVAAGTQTATSTTSFLIGTGSKAFTTQAGKAFTVNQWVIVQETSNPANQMFGQVTAYSGTTLTVNVTATGGSGTHADWTIVLNNSAAAAGYSPPVGTGNVTGPGSSTTGHIATFADGTGKVLLDGGAPVGAANTITASMLAQSAAAFGLNMINGYFTQGVAASAITFTLTTLAGGTPSASDPVWFLFRSSAAGQTNYSVIEVTSALSVTVPASSTLGFSTNTPGRVWLAAINDAGTVSLAVINCLSGTNIYPLAGWGIVNVTAFGGGANNAQVFYGAALHTAVPYSVIGYAAWEAPVTMTAGTWVAPTRMELYRPGVPLPGQVVQSQFASTGANASTANTYTISNTPPAPGNGAAATSVQITPTSSANVLRVRGQALVGNSGNPAQVFAYIHDGTATRATAWGAVLAAQVETLGAQWQTQAGQLAQFTYSLYYAGNAALTVINTHTAATAELGATASTYIQAEEIMA